MKLAVLLVILLSFSSCNYETRKVEILQYDAHEIGDKTCIIGDMGTGKTKQKKVAKLLNSEGCDRVRVTGDVIYPDGLKDQFDPLFQKNFYKRYGDMLEDGIPFFLTMGNHDHYGNPNAWLGLNDQYENIVFPNFWYAERHGDICYINIDTNINYLPEHRAWMSETLSNFEETCNLIISIAHHPFRSSGKHGDANIFNKQYFKKYIIGRVDAHFAGHDHHLSYEGEEDGTQMYITGAGGKLRDVKPLNFPRFSASRLGYAVLTYEYDKFKVEFVSLDQDNKREVIFSNDIKINRR